MRALLLALYMWSLLALQGGPRWEAEAGYRLRLASAIVAVTDDLEEQLTLARIPRFESSYREDVGTCLVVGAAGEVTAWQILARGRAERAGLCVTLVDDARLALARVRESTRACRHLPRDQRLAIYTRGRCDSVEGRRLSQHRYPGEKIVRAVMVMWADRPEKENDDGQHAAAE